MSVTQQTVLTERAVHGAMQRWNAARGTGQARSAGLAHDARHQPRRPRRVRRA